MVEAVEVKKIGNVLVIDGEYYQLTTREGKDGALIFEKIDKKKFDNLIDMLTNRLAPAIKKKDILRDALGELPMKSLEKIAILITKKKVKPRQHHGCIELAVGNETVFIR